MRHPTTNVVSFPVSLSRLGYFVLFFTVYNVIIVALLYFYYVELEPSQDANANNVPMLRPVVTPTTTCYINSETETGSSGLKVRQENGDEFLSQVLEQVNFTEVRLSCIFDREDPENDRSIQMDMDRIVTGLGEDGAEATEPPEKVEEAERIYRAVYLNTILSDLISLNRTLPDFREPECKITYDLSHLPSFSIVMVFLNEPFSIFVRSIHSIFNRTPLKLLKELILVDDYSDHPHLHSKLTRYLATRFPLDKIRLVRLSRRSGLIRARMIGAHLAVGHVLIFLDAHIEVTDYWAEPLLQRIMEDRTVVASPVVDKIDKFSFEYKYNRTFALGSFGWDMSFTWLHVRKDLESDKEIHYSPQKSPTMIGGLFGIERKYFWEMGSYDPGMIIWGGENIEMSFRIWQCGGSLEVIPCSRIGHVYRHARPNSVPSDMPQDTYALNTARLAEVWMDVYKDIYYTMAPKLHTFDSKWTNISLRQEFRKRKKCQSFQWYLDNVYPQKFRMQFDSTLFGQFRNIGAGILCLDRNGHYYGAEFWLEVFSCHDKLLPMQTFYLSKKGELRFENECASAYNSSADSRVQMIRCVDIRHQDNDIWEFEDGRLVNTGANKCLALRQKKENNNNVVDWMTILEDCWNNDVFQLWELKTATDF